MANDSGISRRSFFAGAGLAAGGYAALAPLNAMAAVASGQRSYSTLNLAVDIDGTFAGFATGVDGGDQEARFVSDLASQAKSTIFRITGFSTDAVNLRFTNLPGAKFPDWFAARDGVPRTVALSLVDTVSASEIYRLTLNRARLTGIRSQPFDLGGIVKELFETEVVLVPESITHEIGGQKKRSIPIGQKAKTSSVTSFRLFFQGLEKYAPGIVKIESVGAVAEVIEQRRTSAEVPITLGQWKPEPIKFTVTLDSAAGFYQWFAEMARGTGAVEKSGQLQWVGVDGKVTASIDMLSAQISKVSTPLSRNMGSSDAGAALVQVEVVCEDTKFNYGGLIA